MVGSIAERVLAYILVYLGQDLLIRCDDFRECALTFKARYSGSTRTWLAATSTQHGPYQEGLSGATRLPQCTYR